MACQHNIVTVRSNTSGWVCFDCGVGLLSLMAPIPLPLIERALEVLTAEPESNQPRA